ncbi:vacuolar membrane protein-domain-containing protein [Pavlovales sp. CCMP2436]|nr:vacuolar membrane protein-domain-containing protein [Pavlovales sp. CCMP2436]|mmetsp:Transcript_14768/g.37260  ORF Transcript_14768/g.37260 Transcript_14768/m.37260 type:complete len:282 (+) Transcript_14768:149-994(+)
MTECSLLDAWGIAVQGLLGFGALSTLAYKRQLETPRRPYLIWLFDSSKQAISSGVGHLQNVALSELVLVRLHLHTTTSPCAWYVVNLVLDTTLGTCVSYYVLRTAEVILSMCADWPLPSSCQQALLEMASTGHYGTPPALSRWASQTLLWLFVVTVAKAIVAAVILAAALPLHSAGMRVLRPLEPFPKFEVFVVLVVAPLVLNVIQLWAQDNFLQLRPFSARGTKDGVICPTLSRQEYMAAGPSSLESAPTAPESRTLIRGAQRQRGSRDGLAHVEFGDEE